MVWFWVFDHAQPVDWALSDVSLEHLCVIVYNILAIAY